MAPPLLTMFLFSSTIVSLYLTYHIAYPSNPDQRREITKLRWEGNPQASKYAYVTLVANDDLVLAGLALARSLKQSGTEHDLVVMVTGFVSLQNIIMLSREGYRILNVPFIPNPFWPYNRTRTIDDRYVGYLASLEAGRKFVIFCKLHIFRLVQYEAIAYIDADTIALRNLDDVFNCVEQASQYRDSARGEAPVVCMQGWHCSQSTPDFCMNAGVIIAKPENGLFEDIMAVIPILGTNQNLGDQGALWRYFFFSCATGSRLASKDNETSIIPLLRRHYPDMSKKYWKQRYDSTKNCSAIDLTVLPTKRRKKGISKEGDENIGCGPYNVSPYRLHPREWWPSEKEKAGRTRWKYDEWENKEFEKGAKIEPYIVGNISEETVPRVVPANSCFRLPVAYNFPLRYDLEGAYSDHIRVIHYVDPNWKPWNWRCIIYHAYYDIWLDITSQISHAWMSTYGSSIALFITPFLLSLTTASFVADFSSNSYLFYLSSKFSAACTPLANSLLRHYFSVSLFLFCGTSALLYLYFPNYLHPYVGWFLVIEWCAVLSVFEMSTVSVLISATLKAQQKLPSYKQKNCLEEDIFSKKFWRSFRTICSSTLAIFICCLCSIHVCFWSGYIITPSYAIFWGLVVNFVNSIYFLNPYVRAIYEFS